MPFDKHKYFVRKLTQWWGITYVKIYPFWTVEVLGKEKIKKGKPCIVISNHQSLLDIIFLFCVYPYYTWVSKIENFKVPILGWVMTIDKYIRLERNNPKTFPKMYEDISKSLKDNHAIMMFPEGTRSLNLELGKFKDGAFKAAIENKVGIIPIVLDGTGKIVPKGNFEIATKTKVTLKVLDEIPYESFPSYDPPVLREYIKGIMAEELKKIRNN
jgi:1-acyl-sn-glycerol-3-phosphate acyltransferase